MISVRPVSRDADLERWRQVRMAIVPNERTAGVDELRQRPAEQLLVLAELDGEVVGSGFADRSTLGGQGSIGPRVLTHARRRGVGTALLRALSDHVQALGFDRAGASVDDPGSLAFAGRFGFLEVNRDVEQVRELADEAWPEIPDGLIVVSVAERPELFRRVYHELALDAFADFAVERPLVVTVEDWEREWAVWPEGTFVALCGDEIVGFAGLHRDADRPDRAENSLTAVRRDRRRRGIASLLKRTVIAWAGENGLREIYTWTQRGNEAMRAVNERLGYVTRSACIRVRGELPLPR